MTISRRDFIRSGAVAASLALPIRSSYGNIERPLRIGALNPITGPGSAYGSSMQKAILMAAEEINNAGGVAGKEIRIFSEDTQTAPEAGALAAKKLIEINKVDAILGTWSSGVAAAVMPITDSAGVLHLTNAGASNISSKKGLMFRFSALSKRVGHAQASMISNMGYKRLATMAFNNPSGREITQGAQEGWKELGSEVVAAVVYEPERPGYRSEVQKVLASNPDAIIVGGYISDFSMIVREARQAGSDVQFFASAWSVNQRLIESLGAAATEGIMTHDYIPALEGDAFKIFSEKFLKATGTEPSENYYACCAYDMMQVTAIAAEAAAITGSEVRDAMHVVAGPPGKKVYDFAGAKELLDQGEKINYEGVSGPIDFDSDGNVKPLFKLSQVQDGKVVYVRRVFEDY